jgi:hypothetical protein
VDDALLNIGGVNISDTELRRVTFQCFQLLRAFGVSNRDIVAVVFVPPLPLLAVYRRISCRI